MCILDKCLSVAKLCSPLSLTLFVFRSFSFYILWDIRIVVLGRMPNSVYLLYLYVISLYIYRSPMCGDIGDADDDDVEPVVAEDAEGEDER